MSSSAQCKYTVTELLTRDASRPAHCFHVATVPERSDVVFIHLMFLRSHVRRLPTRSPVIRITYSIAAQTAHSLFMSRLYGPIWQSCEMNAAQRTLGNLQLNGGKKWLPEKWAHISAEEWGGFFFLLSILVANHRVAAKADAFHMLRRQHNVILCAADL